MVEADHSGSVLLTRRLLWNGVTGKPPRPQPVVLLLGPVGAGKSHALAEITDHLGWGVVHARFDFAADDPSPVDVLIRLAYNLSRKWRNRAQPRFLRFTVALIAVGAELTTTDRVRDKETLRRLLVDFKRSRWPGRLDPLVRLLLKTHRPGAVRGRVRRRGPGADPDRPAAAGPHPALADRVRPVQDR